MPDNNTISRKQITVYRVILVILFLALLAALLFPRQKNVNQSDDTQYYSLLDPARKIIPQEDYLINLQNLRDYLLDIGKQYPDTISIYYEQINSGSNVSINKDVHLFPASLTKVVLGIIAAKKVNDGTWTWDKQFTVQDSDIDSGSGELYKTVKAGDSFSLEDLVKDILADSDNTANNILRRNAVVDDYLSFQDETGLQDLYNDQGLISAKEYTRILRVLYTSSYLEPEDSQKILQYMGQSTFHDYLSQGIPSNITFAHKYGENKEQSIFNDSGIVYSDGRPYMITVLIKGKDSTDATRQWAVNLMKDISQHAYDAGLKAK